MTRKLPPRRGRVIGGGETAPPPTPAVPETSPKETEPKLTTIDQVRERFNDEEIKTVEDIKKVMTPEAKDLILKDILEHVQRKIEQGKRIATRNPGSAVEARGMANVIGPSAGTDRVYQFPASLYEGKIVSSADVARMNLYTYVKQYFGYDLKLDDELKDGLEKYTNLFDISEKNEASSETETPDSPDTDADSDDAEEPEQKTFTDLDRAVEIILEKGKATQKIVQTELGISREAARALIHEMEEKNIIGPQKPGKSREILVDTWPPAVEENTDSTEGDEAPPTPPVAKNPAPRPLPKMSPRPWHKKPDTEAAPPQSSEETDEESPDPADTPEARPIPPWLLDKEDDEQDDSLFGGGNWEDEEDDEYPTPPRQPLVRTRRSIPIRRRRPIVPEKNDSPPALDDEESIHTIDTEDISEELEEKSSRWSIVLSPFRGAFERFASRFKGEVQPEDDVDNENTLKDLGESAAANMLGLAASYAGVKFAHDFPAWLCQKYFSNPAERKRIKEALWDKEFELENKSDEEDEDETELTPIEQQKKAVADAINASKYMTAETKKQVLKKIEDAIQAYGEKSEALLKKIGTTVKAGEETHRQLMAQRDAQIAKYLDEAIQARIKNAQLFKEGLNMAFMATGFQAARGAAYGAVAAYERHKEVLADSERSKQYLKEMTYKAFTDTTYNLIGGGADTWTGRGLNVVKGATNILRVVGFTELAISELKEEGVEKMLDATLTAWEEKGIGGFAWENIKNSAERVVSAPGRAYDALSDAKDYLFRDGGSEAPEAPPSEAPSGKPELSPPAKPPSEFYGPEPAPGETGADGSAIESSGGRPETGSDEGSTTPEVLEGTSSLDIPRETLDLAIVRNTPGDEDGIVKILMRQGVSVKQAIEAAREQGIIRSGGDTRLTSESIGRLAVIADTSGGDLEIKFFDTETQKMLSLDEIRTQGFTYESGTVPGQIATADQLIAQATRQIALEDVGAGIEATDGVPHELSGGGLEIIETETGLKTAFDLSQLSTEQKEFISRLFTEADVGSFLATEAGVDRTATRLVIIDTVLDKLESRGYGESVEANYLRGLLDMGMNNIEMNGLNPLFEPETLSEMNVEADQFDQELYKGIDEADRIDSIRVRGLGTVEFRYNDEGKPSLNWQQLAKKSGKFIERGVDNLLVENWEDQIQDVAENQFQQLQIEIGGPMLLMLDAIKELEANGHGDSSEATFLQEQLIVHLRGYAGILDAEHPLVKEIKEHVRLPEGMTFSAPEAIGEISDAAEADTGESLQKFESDAGTIKFRYNDDGTVQDAFMPAYRVSRSDIEAALQTLGLTPDQVSEHFLNESGGEWSPEASTEPTYATSPKGAFGDHSARANFNRFTEDVERLIRQETLLRDMNVAGLEGTPEYKYWQTETTDLRKWVQDEMKKEFPTP